MKYHLKPNYFILISAVVLLRILYAPDVLTEMEIT